MAKGLIRWSMVATESELGKNSWPWFYIVAQSFIWHILAIDILFVSQNQKQLVFHETSVRINLSPIQMGVDHSQKNYFSWRVSVAKIGKLGGGTFHGGSTFHEGWYISWGLHISWGIEFGPYLVDGRQGEVMASMGRVSQRSCQLGAPTQLGDAKRCQSSFFSHGKRSVGRKRSMFLLGLASIIFHRLRLYISRTGAHLYRRSFSV